ncbi:MAG: DsbA family protein [Bacteriovoracia bacterium]
MKNKFILVAVAVVVLITGFILASKSYKAEETKRLEFVAKEDFRKFVPEYAPKLGPTNPDVYLVEFLDPECESCRLFFPIVKSILQENEGKVQLVVRYAPFHPNSKFAIKILEAARKQGKYWETLTVLFQHQPEWGSHHHPRPELIWTYLPQAGVDIEKIKVDMTDPAIDEMIEQEVKDLNALGVRGTPTFFVNGRPLETFGVEPLKDLIQEEIQKKNN